MDLIHLKNLQFYGYHGVFDSEAETGQPFILNLWLDVDLDKAMKSDDLDDTVSYAEIFECVKMVFVAERCHLIEALSQKIISAVFDQFPLVKGIRLKIEKPEAPIEGSFEGVGVEIYRSR